MITAMQARGIVQKIDWTERLLKDIERSIRNLADSGYTKLGYRFSSVIPKDEATKVISKLGKVGFQISKNPKDDEYYIISWKEIIDI